MSDTRWYATPHPSSPFKYSRPRVEVGRLETLILWGDHNPGVGTDFGEYVADVLGAKFYEFVDAGHWPQWEKPDEHAKVIIEFLDS